MYRGKTVGVVIPAYDEEDTVGEVIESVPSFVDRVYAVDDASTDDTWNEILRSAGRMNESPAVTGHTQRYENRVVTENHSENRGVGGAIKTGYLRALEDEIDVVAVMAADGQMEPSALESIVDPVADGRADYAKGNRLLRKETRREVPKFRLFGNYILTYLTKVASGYWRIGDPQNGYSAISRHALEEIDVEEMYEFYGYCNDLLVKLNAANIVVADVPAPILYEDETSHINYSTYIPKVSLMLFRNFVWRLKKKYVLQKSHISTLLYGVSAFVLTLAVVRTERSRWTPVESVVDFLVILLPLFLVLFEDKRANDHLAETVSVDGPDSRQEMSENGSSDP